MLLIVVLCVLIFGFDLDLERNLEIKLYRESMATDADKNKARKTFIKRHNKANKQASMWQHLAKNKQTNKQN